MNFRVLLNRRPTSTQLISASTEFLATPLTLLEPKYHMYLGSFLKFRWKIQICLFRLKIGPQNMVRILILIPTLIFSISNPESIFRQSCPAKVKIIMFMILFPPDRLHYCNLGHCVPYGVFMFCELVLL